jgi:hypothetical protein
MEQLLQSVVFHVSLENRDPATIWNVDNYLSTNKFAHPKIILILIYIHSCSADHSMTLNNFYIWCEDRT